MEARNLASRDSIGRDDIIRVVRERDHRPSGNRKKGSNALHAMLAGGGSGGGGRGNGTGGGGRGNGRSGRQGHEGRGGKTPTKSVVARSPLPVAKAAAPKDTKGSNPEARCYRRGKKGQWKADCTEELCSRCQGRGHALGVPASAEKRCSRCRLGR